MELGFASLKMEIFILDSGEMTCFKERESLYNPTVRDIKVSFIMALNQVKALISLQMVMLTRESGFKTNSKDMEY